MFADVGQALVAALLGSKRRSRGRGARRPLRRHAGRGHRPLSSMSAWSAA